MSGQKRPSGALGPALAVLVACVLAVSLAAIGGTAVIMATAARPAYAEKVLREQDYFASVAASLRQRNAEYFTQADIMQQALPSIITTEAVEESMLYNLHSVYNGSLAHMGYPEAFRALQAALVQGYEDNGIAVTPELAATIEELITECEQSWVIATALPQGNLLVGLLQGFAQIRWWVLAGAGLLALWAVWLLTRLAASAWHRYTGAAVLGAGLALAGGSGILLFSGAAAGLGLDFLLMHGVVTAFLEGVLRWGLAVGGILCIIGGVVWLIAPVKKAEKTGENKEKYQPAAGEL